MFGLFKKKGIDDYERELANPSPEKRMKAARSLGGVKEFRAVELLISALRDNASEVREAAAKALGRLQNSDAVQPLARTLDDSDNRVRLAAGASLMQLGDPRGLEPMLRTLNDPDEKDPNETVALSIFEMNNGVELVVRTLKEHSDEEVRRLAALVLTCTGTDEPLAAEALTRAGKEDTAAEVRKVAADALQLIGEVEGRGHREAFCLRCRSNQRIRDAQAVTLMNGRPATVGVCPVHGTRVFRLGKG